MPLSSLLGSGAARMKSLVGRTAKTLPSVETISEESLARYCKGGYHPVRIGDTFNHGKYKVVRKLGYGVYSTVWLAFDSSSRRHVALKVLTADTYGHGHDTFELSILQHINKVAASKPGTGHILELLDQFEHRGPHGNHICLIFKAMGPDLSKFRRHFPKLMIPLPLLKDISRQLLLAISTLHDTCKVIHTDIKPQNILIETPAINEMFEKLPSESFNSGLPTLPPPNDFYMASAQVSSGKEDLANPVGLSVRLADFGTASWFDKHLTEWIQPQQLRAPEVILGAQWDHKVDIWNLGLIIWELAQGSVLFDGTWAPREPYTPEAHLAQMTAILGTMPQKLLDRSSSRDKFYSSDGVLLKPSTFPPIALENATRNPNLSGVEKENFLQLIRSMIQLDPQARPDAQLLLQHPWLTE